jgi:hypothetical protein
MGIDQLLLHQLLNVHQSMQQSREKDWGCNSESEGGVGLSQSPPHLGSKSILFSFKYIECLIESARSARWARLELWGVFHWSNYSQASSSFGNKTNTI